MISRFKDKFLLLVIFYTFLVLGGLLILSFLWLPPGYTLAGHDSGLPLDARQFLLTRLYAWDDRIGFGLDNSVNFGSLTIHFFDWISASFAQVPYAGNFLSIFFWLGLMFLSSLFFAYQFKDIFGKPFVFILPPLLTFNFYVFQSMFMLERGKFGVYSATLVTLGLLFRIQNKKIGIVSAAIISALLMSIFNGGGLLGITLYGGVILVLGLYLIFFLAIKTREKASKRLLKILSFFAITAVFYLSFNAYSLLPFFKQFLADRPTALFEESLVQSNQEWLAYVSRSASFLNLFREYGIPDWYGGWGAVDKPNPSHPYSFLYLNSKVLVFISFLFPILSFLGLALAKHGRQRRTLAFFGIIALVGIFLTAGSHEPLGFVYRFLMEYLPGFVLFRSAFYKFGIFYLFGMLVMLTFTISFLLGKFSSLTGRFSGVVLGMGTLVFLGFWSAYHWVLFDPTKIFAWKTDQSTKVQIPGYVYDFASWVKGSNLGDKRVLLLPSVNKDWEADAYEWGYWSLSPLFYALSSVNILANWHGLTLDERNFVDRLYDSIKENNQTEFLALAQRLNVGYFLLRRDVLTNSSWSSAEDPQNYQKQIKSFDSIEKVKSFGEWDFYQVIPDNNTGVYATVTLNFVQDKYVSLANEFFKEGHSVSSSILRLYPALDRLPTKRMEVYDCLSCPLERKAGLQSLPKVRILPSSIFYFLKEKHDATLLAQNKDSRGRMADYLGLVLRRSAEQQSMLDLGVNEKYLVQNASVVRSYLGEVYSSLAASPESADDFELANQVLEYLSQAERVFSDRVRRSDFKATSQQFIDEMLGVLWEIELVKDFFAPLLGDVNQWATQKVYKVILSESGKYDIFFPSGNLPRDLSGQVILPQAVEFRKDGRTEELKLESASSGWLTARISGEKGVGQLILHFNELPNLLKIERSGLEKFSFGKAACYKGSITNFDQKRAYEVRVWKSDRLKPVKIIFRDDTFVYSDKHGFLQGEDSFEVPASSEGRYARYVFFPSVSADQISLYICSDSADLPPVDRIEVKELFSPPVIGVRGSYSSLDESPSVNYLRKDPTLYEGEIGDVQTKPYILVLNAKFNPSWKLTLEDKDGSVMSVREHFMVDGYANGWLITKPKVKKFKIEYRPQDVFNKASVFSSVSILLCSSWLVFSLLRGKGKNGN